MNRKRRGIHNLKEIISSIEILSRNSYVFEGKTYTSLNSRPKTTDSEHNYLDLKDLIYHVHHSRKNISGVTHTDEYQNEEFLELLSKANVGFGTWDAGWRLASIHGNNLVVQRDGLTLWASKKEFSRYDESGIGSEGYLFLQKEYRRLNSGFYMALSNALFIYERNYVKVYWNIKPEAGPLLVNEITKNLNASKIPFRFKILNNPQFFPRSDAAVLYMSKDNLLKSKTKLKRVYQIVRKFLWPETSLFAKRLAPGVALAEEIFDEEGFGQRISRLLAESMINAHCKRITATNEMLVTIRQQFEKDGLDVDRPYLNPNSKDDYDLLEGF